ncbi:uncharacterized protein [Amphiura filiformis]|uniref:uncharacterized protein n=1 Tax=Amphiura filiformis TaxID=82378 RepID=UPI003B2157C0
MASFAIDVRSQHSDFQNNEFVNIHCILGKQERIRIKFSNFPGGRAICRMAHISFPGKSSERRGCLIIETNELQDERETLRNPRFVYVESSCMAEWRDDRLADNERYSSVCILKWRVVGHVPSLRPKQVRLQLTDLPLVVGSNDCDCTKPAVIDEDENEDDDGDNENEDDESDCSGDDDEEDVSEQDDEEDDESDNDDEVRLVPETIRLVGSNFEPRYQVALDKIRDKMSHHETIHIQVKNEPENPMDTNALKVEAELSPACWTIIGYVPKAKIPKVTSALKYGELVSCKLKGPPFFQLHPVRSGLAAVVILLKKHAWMHNDNRNTYNSDLSYI